MLMSNTVGKLAEAMAKAQSELGGAIKDATNPFYKSGYATLQAVIEVAKEPLTKNGLSIVQFPYSDGDQIGVETVIMHSSGEWMSGKYQGKPVKNDPQGIGSCISYFRRYAYSSVCGIYQEDDDGNLATHGASSPEKVAKMPKAKFTIATVKSAFEGASKDRQESFMKWLGTSGRSTIEEIKPDEIESVLKALTR